MHKLTLPLSVVCHDAGATNLILAWLESWGGSVKAYMEGPAVKLWQNAFPGVPLSGSLEEVLDGAISLVTGTGWASQLEHDARQLAHKRGIYCVAVLDHWVNYPQRFERNGLMHWPDELWVADEYALRIAQDTLPSIPVRQFDNLYLKDQLARVQSSEENGTLLYVLEPVRQTWGKGEEGEFQALDFALNHVNQLLPSGIKQIVLRLHPSESPEKYQAYLARDPRICMDASVDMAEALSRANLVVGVESSALTLALAAGRSVYSSLPPWAPALRLPHVGIQQIRHLSSL